MALSVEADACGFCGIIREKGYESIVGSVAVIRDRFPVTDGHRLVIPLRHVPDWFDLSEQERKDTLTALEHLRNELVAGDASISGFNVGVNAGESAGQTIGHAHTHLIPRRSGDMDNPRGGVRGVIPDKQSYAS